MAGKSEDAKKKAVLLNDSDSGSEKDEDYDTLLSLMRLNLGPKKKLLVLSLNGLLCHRLHSGEKTLQNSIRRRPDATYGNFEVYKRPHCTDFMQFCLEKFEVGIWSSSREWNVSSALDCIMVGLKSKALFVWDQEQCTDTGFTTLDNKDKPLFLKELGKIWGNKYFDQYSSKNALLIDTNPYKALLNPPNTAVFPYDYKANQVNDDALGSRGGLRLYLDGLVDADDVPSYVKSKPFGQPEISSMHPDWDFYSKIIRRYSKN